MRLIPALAAGVLWLGGCGLPPPAEESRVYRAGDAVTIGTLTYNVLDTRILRQLGDNPDTARFPNERFYVARISIQNSGSSDEPVPAIALVSDEGQVYNELTDGSGLPEWLGIVRTAKRGQPLEGAVLFDAPATHYRLRLTEEYATPELSIDLPLRFSDAAPQ
ncbi:MAG TPA: DUF4352 domain-containing protein [Bryobacteraceae bacterium]|jgi:hypothetical protein|nr:DUF4352 domain-containing protein [Bryobacteraceae bacterium]